MNRWFRSGGAVVSLLFALSLLAYCRALFYPFISDDYLQIRLARLYISPGRLPELAVDALYRCRATSLFLTAATDRLFGLSPLPYSASSLALHVLIAGLVFGVASRLGFRRSAALAAAAFYAVYEGHQEAVIWYAALPEQLVVLFALLSIVCWLAWLRPGGARRWYAASLASFVLALLSKESAPAVVPLLLLTAWWLRSKAWRAVLAAALPFALLAAVYAALIFANREDHLFFHDGTFTLGLHILQVLPRSLGRLLFFWGALAALLVGRSRRLTLALVWMAAALVPYSFLTYMNQVPSRHTYFASVGLALLAGSAWEVARQRWGAARPWLAPALAALVVFHNCAYLWTRKHQQYLERAAPTEALLRHLEAHRQHRGPVWVLNFPYDRHIAYSAVAVATDRNPDSVVVANTSPQPGSCVLRWDGARLDFHAE